MLKLDLAIIEVQSIVMMASIIYEFICLLCINLELSRQARRLSSMLFSVTQTRSRCPTSLGCAIILMVQDGAPTIMIVFQEEM